MAITRSFKIGQYLGRSISSGAIGSDGSAGGGGTLGQLTKTFTNDEVSTFTLSQEVTPIPNIDVYKEIPQSGITTKGSWDVNSTASNYEFFDEAASRYSGASITPSNSVADGTFTLSSGSFDSTDIGKRVVGNGGEATITSTGGAYKLINSFSSGAAISSGNWKLHGAKGDANGITLNSYDIPGSFPSSSAGSAIQTGTNFANGQGGIFSPDGLHYYQINQSDANSIYHYTLSTAFDISSSSMTFTGGNSSHGFSTALYGARISSDGTKVYAMQYGTGHLWQADVTTPYQTQSGLTNPVSHYLQTDLDGAGAIYNHFWKSDGTKFYAWGNNSKPGEWSCSTPWDISTASHVITLSGFPTYQSGGMNNGGFWMSADGTKMIVYATDYYRLINYELTTPWDLSTLTYHSNIANFTNYANVRNIFFAGNNVFTDQSGNQGLKKHTVSAGVVDSVASYPASQYFPTITGSTGQINTSTWNDLDSLTADETSNDGTVAYAVSTDNRTTWKINKEGGGVRSIARNNAGVWQYNSNAAYANETWTNSTYNNEHAALQQALSVTINVMNKTQMADVTDANEITLGNTFDLMIAPYAASGTAPVSDGATIGYAAAALIQKAVPGTDYNVTVNGTAVSITSLSSQNLKARAV